jgi:hypothetical protein
LSVQDPNGNPIPGASVCSLNCNPLNPQDASNGWSACGPNVNCAPGTQSIPVSDCDGNAFAGGTQGVDCTGGGGGDGPCAPGFSCAPTQGISYSCAKSCRVGNTGDCPKGLNCTVYSPAAYVGSTQYGYCG